MPNSRAGLPCSKNRKVKTEHQKPENRNNFKLEWGTVWNVSIFQLKTHMQCIVNRKSVVFKMKFDKSLSTFDKKTRIGFQKLRSELVYDTKNVS
jgi:hypothetical protein